LTYTYQERSPKSQRALVLTLEDWRFSLKGASKGNPKIPGDSLEDYVQEESKIDLTPKGLFEKALGSGEISITKKIIGRQRKKIEEQRRELKELERAGW